MKKVKFKSVFFRLFLLVLTVFVAVFSPLLKFSDSDDMNYIYSTFIGKKSEYNGVLEVWNIDSFESGTMSKVSLLENFANKFQKENKGIYIVVRNLTESELVNLLESNQMPDVISCSYGVAEKIKDYVCEISKLPKKMPTNFADAGKLNGKQYGLAWCTGFYSLMSTKAKLEKAGKDVSELNNIKLNEIAFSSGYEYKSGKHIKKSTSLVYGEGNYLMPKNALFAYNRAGSIQSNNDSENELVFKSQYSAYSSFLSNGATILLGTHRDIIRMENRVESGKVSDVVIQPILSWTDLVQFAFVCKQENPLRKKYAEMFVLYLLEERNQRKVETIGMFPILAMNETDYKGAMRDIILENFSDCELKKIFG